MPDAPAACARLSVNINAESADVLRRVMRQLDISATEAVRRAIGLLQLAEAGQLVVREDLPQRHDDGHGDGDGDLADRGDRGDRGDRAVTW